jgi:hypothetical protein
MAAFAKSWRRRWPAIPRGAQFVCYRLPRHQYLHAGRLNVMHMHKNIGAAAIGCDKAISAIFVEEFDPSIGHPIPHCRND